MMRRATFLLGTCLACMAAMAQEVGGNLHTTDSITVQPPIMETDTYNAIQSTRTYSPEEYATSDFPIWQHSDSLHLPTLDNLGQVWSTRLPFFRPGWSTWNLHQGLNVNLGAYVIAGWGKHSSGTGFGQNISAMYATPLTSKLSLAVGGYFSNLYWDHSPFRSAGVSAVLGYRFDDHWEAFIYGQKTLTENRFMPHPLYYMGDLGDRIGAAVRYNFNPSFSVEVSLERRSWPHHDSFHDTYMQMPRGNW